MKADSEANADAEIQVIAFKGKPTAIWVDLLQIKVKINQLFRGSNVSETLLTVVFGNKCMCYCLQSFCVFTVCVCVCVCVCV